MASKLLMMLLTITRKHMSKVIKAVSPKGKASWPKLFKPDTRFNPEGVYQTGLILSPAEAADFQEKVKEAFVEEYGKGKLDKALMPWKLDEEGNVVLNFKSKRKPLIVDSQGQAINGEINVGGGSIIKVGTGINPWSIAGKMGVTLYLNAVQIIELVEFNGSPFGKEEGGFVATTELEAPETQEDASAVKQAEEDIDF
jgi:hypothetical protein